MKILGALVCTVATTALVLAAPAAHACGGCFHPRAEVGTSVVTDHRMVFKLSANETVLWDQIRYTGAPQEFAWVLPVQPGARVELARDEWIGVLDLTTQSVVTGPERSCGGGGGGGSNGGGCMSSTTETASAFRGGGAADAGLSGNQNVQVVSQQVIGPYETVTIRSTDGQGIADWLTTNGFAIPDDVRPTVDAYTRERFDFIALRLRPGEGVNAMRPVRVVSAGAVPTLPLRMVAAGVGAKVGLTLWVISEGRYQTKNFPSATIDEQRLVWDGRAARSNLSDLEAEALAKDDGRTWITQAALPASRMTMLGATYQAQCRSRAPSLVACDGGQPSTDAGDDAEAGSDADAGDDADAGSGDDAGCTTEVSGCDDFDDYAVAMRGLHQGDVWVTRLRADLPVTALATDLEIEAAPAQEQASPIHHTDAFSDPNFDPCAGVAGGDDDGCACHATRPLGGSTGTALLAVATALGAARIVRRRRRAKVR